MLNRSASGLLFTLLAGRVPATQPGQSRPQPIVAVDSAQSLLRRFVGGAGGRVRIGFEPQELVADTSVRRPEWFVAYQLIALDAPPDQSFNRGFYAVNRVTGDVWELVLCKRVSNPTVTRFRERVRGRSPLSAAAWRQAAAERPCPPM